MRLSYVVVFGALALVTLFVFQFRQGSERKIEEPRSAVDTPSGPHAGLPPNAAHRALASGAGSTGLPGAPGGLSVKPEHTASAHLVKPLKEARDDLQAQKYTEAIAKLKEADITSGKSTYDQHIISEFMGFACAHTNDFTCAAKAWEAVVDDGFTAQADQKSRVRALSQLNYQIKNYDKAIAYGRRALKGGYGNEDMEKAVGQAYYLKGDWKGTREFESELVSAAIKRGETPTKEWLQLLYSACFKLHDNECAWRALEQLKRYYPGTDPMAPQRPVGTVFAYFFGPPQDVEGQKPPAPNVAK